MKTTGNPLLWLAGGSMEICWLYAWATFLSSIFRQRPFPLIEAAVCLVIGVFVARLTNGKGFRIVSVLLFHLIGLMCVSLWTVHALYFSGTAYSGFDWFRGFAATGAGFVEWIRIILTLFWVIVFWISGIKLAKRPKTYYAFCARFDIGLAAFFSLYLLRLVMFARGGIRTDDPVTHILPALFLLCGLFALGMARVQNQSLKEFLPGYRKVGIVLGYSSTLILLVSSLVLWSLSRLSSLAGSTNRVMKEAAVSSLPMVEQLLRIVFSRSNIRPEGTGSSSRGSAWNMAVWARESWWMEYLEKVLGWGFWGVFWALSLIVLGLVALLTVRWLFSRTASDPERESTKPLLSWFLRLWNLLRTLAEGARVFVKGYHRASDFYGGILRWARRSGISPQNGETPLEFGARLGKCIPRLTTEIDIIINSYNREVYGETSLAGEGSVMVRRAWRILRSPLNWPSRLRTRFIGRNGRSAFQ